MLITKKRYNKIKKSKNQSRKLPKRRKKQKKFRRSFRKRHLDLKRKTLKNRKKRVMKGGSLSRWTEKHPQQYAEALSAGIDRRTLENAYRSITQGMVDGEKVSYDMNSLTSNSGKLLSGNDIPETFNKQVTRIINKKKAVDAEKKANENKGVNLSPTSRGRRRRVQTPGLPPRGPPTGKEIVERTKAEEIKRKQLIQKRKKGVEKRRTAKRRYRRSPEAKKRRAARKRQTRSKKRKASQKGSSMINNIITRNIQDIAAKQAEESSTNENSPSVPITGTDNIEMGKVGKSETSTNISENTNTNLTRFPIVPSHPVALETDKPKIKEKRKDLLPPLSPTNIDIMYKRAKIPRKAGYIPALPMDLKTTPRAYASDRMPYGYVNIGFLKAQENNPGPGTWMPSTTGIPFVASSWITKKRPAGKRRKKTPPPRVIFPSRQSSISSSNIAGQKTDDQTIRPEIAGASTNAPASPKHSVTSLKIKIKALKTEMKRIEKEPWGKDAFKSISSGRKIKANVQRLSRNINAQKSKTPAILDYYKRQIAEQQRQLIILTKNLQNAGAKQNSNSNNNLHVGRSVTSRNTTRRPTYNASSGSNTGNAPIVPIGLGYKSETPEKEDKNDDIFALDGNDNNSNNEMELNEIPVTKDNSRNNDNSSSSDSESDDDNRSNNDNSNNDGGGGSGGITAGAPGRKINLGGDKWVNIRTNIQANPAQVIVTGKIGDNAADTLAILGS